MTQQKQHNNTELGDTMLYMICHEVTQMFYMKCLKFHASVICTGRHCRCKNRLNMFDFIKEYQRSINNQLLSAIQLTHQN